VSVTLRPCSLLEDRSHRHSLVDEVAASMNRSGDILVILESTLPPAPLVVLTTVSVGNRWVVL
jgi:hypothetical protein